MSAITPNSNSLPSEDNSSSVRWGLGDAIWVWLGSLAVTLFAGSAFGAIRGTNGITDIWALVASALIQNASIIGFIVVVSQIKGVGSLRRDFGFCPDWPAHSRDHINFRRRLWLHTV